MITAILSLVILAATFYYLFGTKVNKSKNNYGSGIVKISSLITYPIKSCAGISVPKIRLTRLGLAYDRVWLFVDCSKGSKNIFITQRQNPKLARVVPRLVNSKGEDDVVNPTSLILSAPDMPTLTVPAIGNKREDLKDKEVIDVVVWNNDLKGVVVSRECDEWITGYLGRQCRFVSIVSFDEFERKLNPAYDCNPAEDNIQTAFADGFPILLGSTASLKPVNAKMEELRKSQSPPASPSEDDEVAHLPDQPMDILQFRPNIIISGDDLKPFAEDYWKTIKFESKEDKDGGVECTVVKGCDRCILPNTDQTRGVRDQTTRVTSALKAFRTGKMITGATKQQDRVFWGENLIHSKSSVGKFLHVGDELIVKSAAKQMTM